MKKIVINATISAEDQASIVNALNRNFDGHYRYCNEEIANKVYRVMSESTEDGSKMTIEIETDGLIKIINIVGGIYNTLKPMIQTLKAMGSQWVEAINNVVGEPTYKRNGIEVPKTTKRVVRRVKTDDGIMTVTIESKTNRPVDEMEKIMDEKIARI